ITPGESELVPGDLPTKQYRTDPIGGVIQEVPSGSDAGTPTLFVPAGDPHGDPLSNFAVSVANETLSKSAEHLIQDVVDHAAPGELAPGAAGLAEAFGPVVGFTTNAVEYGIEHPNASLGDAALNSWGKTGAQSLGAAGGLVLGPGGAILGAAAAGQAFDAANNYVSGLVDQPFADHTPAFDPLNPTDTSMLTPLDQVFPLDSPSAGTPAMVNE